MKNLYAVIVVENSIGMSADDFLAAYANATPVIIEGLQAVFEYCGGKLYRGRTGYGGMNNGNSYYAYKVNKGVN